MSSYLYRTCAAGRACSRNWAGPSRPAARCFHLAPSAAPEIPTGNLEPSIVSQPGGPSILTESPIRRADHDARGIEDADGFFTSMLNRRARPSASLPFGASDPIQEGYGGSPKDPRRHGERHRISDHEYSVRVGQAFDLLRATIPDFMRIGLVDYDDARPSSSSSPSGMNLLDVLTFRSLRARSGAEKDNSELQGGSSSLISSASVYEGATGLDDQLASAPNNLVYHPKIQFRFCAGNHSHDAPSSSELSDAEAASLSFSGRSLYFASAHALRHTLNILFSNTKVEIERIRLEKRGRDSAWCDAANTNVLENDGKQGSAPSPSNTSKLSSGGGDAIHLRVRFTGDLRLTNIEHQYTLVFRYDIDGETGRIAQHTVERIEPAIGRKLWTVIANVWDRITGHSSRLPDATPMPAPCIAHHRQSAHFPHKSQGDRVFANGASSK